MERRDAAVELVRFWLERRADYLTLRDEPVTDRSIDLLAHRPADGPALAGGFPKGALGPRLAVEVRSGRDGAGFVDDVAAAMRAQRPKSFHLLSDRHVAHATERLGARPDRLFVFHAFEPASVSVEARAWMEAERVFVRTLPSVVGDLRAWWSGLSRKAPMRSDPVGEMLDLLWSMDDDPTVPRLGT